VIPGFVATAIISRGFDAWSAQPGSAAAAPPLRRAAVAATNAALGVAAAVAVRGSAAAPSGFAAGTAARSAQTPWVGDTAPPPLAGVALAAAGGVLGAAVAGTSTAGTFGAFQRAAFLAAHATACAVCAAGPSLSCYATVVAGLASNYDFPFRTVPPAVPLYAAPHRASVDDADMDTILSGYLRDGVAVPLAEGTVGVLASVFLHRPVAVVLSPSQLAACTGPRGVSAALTIARGLAAGFLGGLVGRGPSIVGDASYASSFAAALAAATTPRAPRWITNMRVANDHIEPWRYEMFTVWDLLQSGQPGDLYFKVDVKAGLTRLVLSESARVYTAFSWRGRLYALTRLPFGVITGPALFSFVTAEVNRILLSRANICSIVYIDDFIGRSPSYYDAVDALDILTTLLNHIGLTVSVEKSSSVPTTSIEALGLEVRADGSVAVPAHRMVKTFLYALVVEGCAAAGLPVPRYFTATLGGLLGWLCHTSRCSRPSHTPCSRCSTARV
jgi:hypothetical protein